MSHPPHLALPRRAYNGISKRFTNLRRLFRRLQVAYTVPSPLPDQDLPFSAHGLVCHGDLLLAICSAKAASLACGSPLPWVFHDDGTLTATDSRLLARHFPGCRIVTREESDRAYQENFPAYASLLELRLRHVMLLKLADLYVFSDKPRILYCDSDVLFIRRPSFLLYQLHQSGGANYFNKDIASAYITESSIIQELTGTRPVDRLNAGLSVLNRCDITLEKISFVLSQLAAHKRTDWSFYGHLIEQTVVAVLTSGSSCGARHLPSEYDLRIDASLDQVTTRHYVGKIRHRYEPEGLGYLLNHMSFMSRWKDFVRSN